MRNFWTLKLSRLIFFLAILNTLPVFGQMEERSMREEPYFLFPIKPGEQNTLAGTMGELRSSHFHTGLDIRTEGRTGLNVHASADGYISRVAVSPYGYGNALYITHPTGHITVYAHLDKFVGPIADYVRQEMYRRKESALNLYFHKGRFPVSKGDVVALSGNSGSSGGPHLHYDIRDANNEILNPLQYGFDEILDNTPPVVGKVALKTMDKYARVNDEFGRFEFDVRRIGNNYVIEQPIPVYGTVGIELYAYDKLDYARFRCGVSEIRAYANDTLFFEQETYKLSFAQQRHILRHMSYEALVNTGRRYHKLYVDDGNELSIYNHVNDALGKLNLLPGQVKRIKVIMKDPYGNESKLEFYLKAKAPDYKVNKYVRSSGSPKVEEVDNTLVIKTPVVDNNEIEVYLPEAKTIGPSYLTSNEAVYTWDLREGLPYSMTFQDENIPLNYVEQIAPKRSYTYYNEYMNLSFGSNDLFDTLYLKSNYQYDSTNHREIFTLGNSEVPLKSYIGMTLKPQKKYSSKHRIYSVGANGNLSYVGGEWRDGNLYTATRSFGQYSISIDSIAPSITPYRTNANELMFRISDRESGIDKYRCLVNGKWVLMHYDYKRSLIWSEKLNASDTFSGELILEVTDNAGNKKEYKTTI